MRIYLLPLLASALSGVSAIFEKVSVVTLAPLTVLTLRYVLMLPVLLVALYLSGGHRELATISGRTFGAILLLALGLLTLYFTALKGDWVLRVYPLTELGPVITCVSLKSGRRGVVGVGFVNGVAYHNERAGR